MLDVDIYFATKFYRVVKFNANGSIYIWKEHPN